MPPGLPHERRVNNTNQAMEDDLRSLFSKYNTVTELRLLSKPASATKIVGRAPSPNYGFITFADSEAATHSHKENNAVFPDVTADGQKLNIELKKTLGRGEIGGSGGRDRRVMSGGIPGNGVHSSMNSSTMGGSMLRDSNSLGIMRPGDNRSIGGNNGIRGNSFNRSDWMPMSLDGKRPQ